MQDRQWMDEQKEMLHPAATRPIEELPLNPNAPEWFAKPSQRDIHQSDGGIQQYVQQQQQLILLHQQAFQSMASTIRQGFTLPKPGLSSFNGNPVEFWGFI